MENSLEKTKRLKIESFVFDPKDSQKAEKIAQDMYTLDQKRFPGEDVFFNQDSFRKLILNTIPNTENEGWVNVLILVKDSKDNSIFGFIYAEPATNIYSYKEHPERAQEEEIQGTAYVTNAVFKRSGPSGGGLDSLNELLEIKLKENGYKFIDLDATVNFGLAESIRKKYSDKIIREEEHDSPNYGRQVFFRIKI